MSYRSLYRATERYQLTMLWVLLVAFLFAWAMMFVHPSITILTFWLGLIFVGASALILRSYRTKQATAARTSLQGHTCPWCGAGIEHDPPDTDTWHCTECGADFLDSGAEVSHGK